MAMAASDQIGIASLLIGGISSISSAYADAQARKAQADYQAGLDRVNSMFSEVQATDAIQRGEFLAGEIQRKGDQSISFLHRKAMALEGKQRAAYAGQGIEATSGSAADIIADTKFQAANEESILKRNTDTDILTIKSNAWREAWGLKTQAINYRADAAMTGIKGDFLSTQSLLAGGLSGLNYGLKAYGRYRMNAPIDNQGEGEVYSQDEKLSVDQIRSKPYAKSVGRGAGQ